MIDGTQANDAFVDDAPLPMDEGAAAPAPKSEGPSIDDAIAMAFEKQSGQPRDDAGRFAAKQAEQAAKDAAAAQQPVEKAPEATPAPTAGQMPQSWGKADQALWASLSPQAQAKIAAREEQVSVGFKRYEGLAEHASVAERNGQSLKQVLDRVNDLENAMMADPVGTIVGQILPMFRIDPARLAAALTGQAPQPGTQPAAQPAPAPTISPRDIEQTVQREFAKREADAQVQAFMSDPKNKHFESVANTVAIMLRNDRSLSLQDAYDRATWADPQIRAELLREQTAQSQAKQVQTIRTQAQTAQRASKSLTGSASSPVTGQRSMSVDEAIKAAMELHS